LDDMKELKARAYDLMATIQHAQRELQEVTDKIRALAGAESE